MSNFSLRAISGFVLVSIILLALFAGGRVYELFCFTIGALIFYEWLTISGRLTRYIEVSVAIFLFAALLFLQVVASPFLVSFILLSFLLLLLLAPTREDGWTAVGFVYATLPVVSLLQLRAPLGEQSFAAVAPSLFLFFTVWSSDVGGYLFGKLIGGQKLAPVISPNKTVAGAVGSFIASALLAIVFSHIFYEKLSYLLIGLALLLSLITQVGDIGESAFKRYFSVKDSSQIIPGHGGVMDRFDGLIWAAVCLAGFLYFSGLTFRQLVA